MAPPSELSIEPAPEVAKKVCADCGRSFSSVYGFLYAHGDAYAVYHALLQTQHPSTVADIALSFGRWDEGATGDDRRRVGLRVWPDGDELKMHINDAFESAWGDSETFGRMLSRREVLGTDRQAEALKTVEFLVARDHASPTTFTNRRSAVIPELDGAACDLVPCFIALCSGLG